MDAKSESDAVSKNRTTVERGSERELVVSRSFNGPARLVFEAWTKPELLTRWWTPKSFGLTFIACETDARMGAPIVSCSPSFLRAAYGIFRQIHRRGAERPPCLDE